jgi:hypothetical protein
MAFQVSPQIHEQIMCNCSRILRLARDNMHVILDGDLLGMEKVFQDDGMGAPEAKFYSAAALFSIALYEKNKSER